MKQLLKLFLPPVIAILVYRGKRKKNTGQLINSKNEETVIDRIKKRLKYNSEGVQDTDIYWDEEFAKILDTWGENDVWLEIQLLLANCTGKTLDIACGSGPVMDICRNFKNIELYGCDISDLLLAKANEKRGIPKDRLMVVDATKMSYVDDEFNYSYSIGSLEHFTEEGIIKFIAETHRVTKFGSFHLVPTNEKGEDEGWISPLQSYYNNSIEWWLNHFRKSYDEILVVKSSNRDPGRSFSHWFLCYKNLPV